MNHLDRKYRFNQFSEYPSVKQQTTAERLIISLGGAAGGNARDADAHLRQCISEMLPPGMAAVRPELAGAILPPEGPASHVSDPTGLIVETRAHPNLFRIVRQVCDLGLRAHVFHGPGNKGFVHDRFSDLVRGGKVLLTEMRSDALDRDTYNALMLSPDFWKMTWGRGKILLCQTDAILCTASKFRLADFLHLDYVGSAWKRERPEGVVVDGGNGGLSLRDWGRTVECLDRFPVEIHWRGGEDTYFCLHIQLIGGRVANPAEAARFGSQFWFTQRSFGAHKIAKMHWANQVLFLTYCPEAEHILPKPFRRRKVVSASILRRSGLAYPLAWALGRGPDRREPKPEPA